MRARGSVGRILLVEDDEDLLGLLKITIGEAGYTVEAATDGVTAFRAIDRRAGEFCAVILDLGLPGLPGGLVLRRARQVRPDLPVLLATGSRPGEDLPAPDFLIPKPYGPRELLRALADLAGVAEDSDAGGETVLQRSR